MTTSGASRTALRTRCSQLAREIAEPSKNSDFRSLTSSHRDASAYRTANPCRHDERLNSVFSPGGLSSSPVEYSAGSMRRHRSTSDTFTSQALQRNPAASPRRPGSRAKEATRPAAAPHRFARVMLIHMSLSP